jgi:hypothetical protein
LNHFYLQSVNQKLILNEASSVFGVPPPVFARDQASSTTPSVPALRQISSHTLQIEMSGPDFKTLSFIDTPGLFQCKFLQTLHIWPQANTKQAGNKGHDATSVEEIDNLVESLLAEKRTVIV